MNKAFAKIKIPSIMFDLIVDIYYLTRLQPLESIEDFNDKGKVNLLNVNKYSSLKQILLETMKPVHENFSKQKLESVDCYGIKSYWEGRLEGHELISPNDYTVGSIVKVDHDAEPWPLLIKNDKDEIEKINLEIGEMVMFNSNNYLKKRDCELKGLFSRELSLYYRSKL